MPTEHERLRAFAEEMLGIAWEGCDADGGTIQDTAKEHGLLRVVEGGYDPEKHGENTLHDAAPGDPWYEVTWNDEASPNPPTPDYAAALEAVKEARDAE